MGKSSALTAKIVKEKYSKTHDVVYLCNNTTFEMEESLLFGSKVDKFLGLNCVLLEPVVHPQKGQGTTHKIVTWETAATDKYAYKDMVKKYGIPNTSWLHCTRELKTSVATSYLNSIGWTKGSFDLAIGFRADEIDRVPERYKENRMIFPLINAGIKKADVYREFSLNWPFTLEIKEHEGNCKTCFKKSDRKLYTLANEKPEWFDFFDSMEKEFPRVGAEFDKDPTAKNRKFFRRNRSTQDILASAKLPYEPFVDELYNEHFGECEESCEPFVYETHPPQKEQE